jgi:hypothetical protein
MRTSVVNVVTLSGLLAVFGGCVLSEETFRSEVLPRAAFELSCPTDQVAVTRLADDSFGVSGCGRRAVYIYVSRVGYVNNTGIQRDVPVNITVVRPPAQPVALQQGAPAAPLAQAPKLPAQPPSAGEFVLVPLHVYLLNARGDDRSAFAAQIPAIVEQLDRIFEPAGVYFTSTGPVQTIEFAGGVPREHAVLRSNVPSAPEKEGFRLFLVRDLDANGAGLGDRDLVVKERPSLRQVDGGSSNAVARVAAHLLGGSLGLTPTRDESQLMALGTTGASLDVSSAKVVRTAAKQVRGAKSLEEASSTGVFPDAVATIRARNR